MGNIESKLRDIITEYSIRKIKPDDIQNHMSLTKDLGFDSISIVQLMITLEETFDFIFEDEEIEDDTITQYDKLLDLIIKRQEG